MWLVATLSVSTVLQYFLFPYLFFLWSQKRYAFITLKGNSFTCASETVFSGTFLCWATSCWYFLIFSLYWPLSTHYWWVDTYWQTGVIKSNIPLDRLESLSTSDLVLLHPGEKKVTPWLCHLSRSPSVFPLPLHSWRVAYTWCFLCSSLKPYAPAQITSELVMPDLLASFSFYLIFVTFDIVTVLFIKFAPCWFHDGTLFWFPCLNDLSFSLSFNDSSTHPLSIRVL